jgi:hypothetical protein
VLPQALQVRVLWPAQVRALVQPVLLRVVMFAKAELGD